MSAPPGPQPGETWKTYIERITKHYQPEIEKGLAHFRPDEKKEAADSDRSAR